ncbi:MAG TPA: R3H domain-containing nucleic acid-binding protein [Acidobacteriota bacterium]|jgi:spoIIIJ-associated protein|nr:R3H domain-containing nucleic acid-binding protein [Acidobacteriota bacterium]
MSEQREKVASFVKNILSQLGIEADLIWKEKDGQSMLDIHGDDVAVLLANGAKVLYSIEYLCNLIYADKREELRVVLDCNDFRAMRSYELELLAKKAAEKVKTSHRPFPLQPMPANERRIIHLALAEDPQVKTESQGFGDNRRVVILPSE